ncbi:hypothetical protein NQF36_20885, partial [Escherichia coli]|nr:hypothetical protein [Escherichia coli]MDR6063451.1 hypothetical protein [Escherichia coli]
TDGDGSHGSTSKTPSYTKSVSWHHYRVMVPNNRKIINVIEGNMGLLSARQKRLYIDFRDHAEAWEYNQYNRLDTYPLFPEEFQKEFGYE